MQQQQLQLSLAKLAAVKGVTVWSWRAGSVRRVHWSVL
jgi:hypothetical protein